MLNILLTEADYKDKYPPLGLMKIATFHKLRGDNVVYSRRLTKKARTHFSKIYISTRFSFHWKKTEQLINYYRRNYDAEILIGGIHASIAPELYNERFGITPNVGPYRGCIEEILDVVKENPYLSRMLAEIQQYGIDVLPPDYSIFEDEQYPFDEVLKDNYLLRATKGCNRGCSFCDVRKICGDYIPKLPIAPVIDYIDNTFDKRQNILFFDDNTLLSNEIEIIIKELIDCGFGKGATLNRKKRKCDFNQGLDLRKLTPEIIASLNTICIDPVRFAFDDIRLRTTYETTIRQVIESGIRNISVYVLYNHKDTPEDFYERLDISVRLNKEYGSRIFSFPMRYAPTDTFDRKHIGEHWTPKMLRGVQCILNSTHGIVPVNYDFFKVAFGRDAKEFVEIINMPNEYIMYRKQNHKNIERWRNKNMI